MNEVTRYIGWKENLGCDKNGIKQEQLLLLN